MAMFFMSYMKLRRYILKFSAVLKSEGLLKIKNAYGAYKHAKPAGPEKGGHNKNYREHIAAQKYIVSC